LRPLNFVVEQFEPGDAAVVQACVTEHLRRERSLRVDPFRIFEVAEARELEPLERLRVLAETCL